MSSEARPEDTSRRPAEIHLAGAMREGTTDYITNMEAKGQRELVASEMVPIDMRPGPDEYRALGFVFDDNDHDDLFMRAQLPEGWYREGSDHAMWSYILDERGYQRAMIFYKAAFYDRSAHMTLVSEDNQRTTPQAESFDRYTGFHPYHDGTQRWRHKSHREGDNWVWTFERFKPLEDYEGESPEPVETVSYVVAPDGTEVEVR